MTPRSQEEKTDSNYPRCFLKKVFDEFNCSIFGNNLPNFTLVPKLDRSLSLSFQKDKFFFGPAIFFLSPKEVCLSVFHEMTHAINFKRELIDTGSNSYHNKNFLNEVLHRGLFVIKHKNHGWSLISLEYPRNVTQDGSVRCPSTKKLDKAQSVFNSILSNLDWPTFYSHKFSPANKKEYTYKYTCSCPPPFNSIRSGRGPKSPNPPRAICFYCGEEFKSEDG